jgi:polar amino acid transport system substrate-binding protein
MLKKILSLSVATALTAAAATPAYAACSNDVWNKVMGRGKIVIGVKADYKPWGFRDESGNLVGMEIDMAKDVAEKMGVELELVAVQSSNRMQFLEQGKIDLMIATMSDRKDRREIVGIVGPNYYTSGTNLLAPNALNFSEWEQIRGKPVCGKQGAFYNQIVERRRALRRRDRRLYRQCRSQAGLARQEVYRLRLRRQLDHGGLGLRFLGRFRHAHAHRRR